MTANRRTLRVLVATVLTVGVLAAPAPDEMPVTPNRAQVNAPVPDIDWKPCKNGLRCATAQVPLDYDEPHVATTRLALAKHPARDADARIGTLFVNPGGPGDSAVDALEWYVESLPAQVLSRFDVVGVDPRGVGSSSPLRCAQSSDGPERPPWAFPITRRQTRRSLHFNDYVRSRCAATANPIIDHMTTADTARDMDLLRQAFGDERLTYYGISYGSYLGATYAAMFPDRIRAMVVDGVIDPVAYATGEGPDDLRDPVTTRWESARGSWEALSAAFAECDRVGVRRCPIAGDASGTWHRVVERLRRGPARVDGSLLRYQDVVQRAVGALTGVASYRPLMRFIGETHDAMFGRGTTDRASGADHERRPDLELSREGVICADARNPADPRAWVRAGIRSDRRAPWFGRLWTWRSSLCAGWPGSSTDAYRGPFTADTSAPVMLVAHLHDPSTPIFGARRLNSLLEGSRMLTLDGWGHGALGESRCVGSHTARYLITGELPPPGSVCAQDEEPFPRR